MGALIQELLDAGWSELHPERGTERWRTFYRWDKGERVELCLGFDTIGRLEVWSEWRNQRVNIDQEAGRRQRLRVAHVEGEWPRKKTT